DRDIAKICARVQDQIVREVNGRAILIGIDSVDLEAAEQRVPDSGIEIEQLPSSDWKLVGKAGDKVMRAIERRDALSQLAVGVVEVSRRLKQLREAVVGDQRQPVVHALLDTEVEALKVRAADRIVLLDDAVAETSASRRKLGIGGEQLRPRNLAAIQAGAW